MTKFSNKQAKRVWQVMAGHPLPVGTRIKCEDKRFISGYIIGVISKYYQDGWKERREDLDLRRPFSYVVKQWGFFPLHKSPESVKEILNEK